MAVERPDPVRVAELFGAALELRSSERREYLRRACAGDPALRSEVESLLAASDGAKLLPDSPDPDRIAALLGADDDGARSMAGRRIGPYRVISELGRGGMGVVYLAERADGAYQQQVALKVLPAATATKALRARFLLERQILARLEHPGIARLLDGGLSDDGEPYFALELVEGRWLTAWCDARQLPIRERLRLFVQVCEAVQFAHGRLIVHRDLKPSNILVTDDGELKLLDFGIAKLLAEDGDGDATALTRLGLRPLTPEYAAPEQLRNQPVTAATDVYALGVILYELLTGHRPRRANAGQIPSAWQPPMRPSAVVVRSEALEAGASAQRLDPEALAHARATRPERLRRQLRGDLDTIVLTALREEPAGRYGSAEALAEELRRHLAGQPVQARPASLRYRTLKFVQRHTVGVASTAGFVMLLITSALALAVEQRRTAAERDKAEEVRDFTLSLFAVSNPVNESRGDTITAGTLLERGIARIDGELAGQPDVQAQMLSVVGNAFRELGDFDRAMPLLERALAVQRAWFGDEHPDIAQSLSDIGQVMLELGRYEAAESLQRESLAMRRRLLDSGDLDLASGLNRLGVLLSVRGQLEEAEALYREALAIRRKRHGPEHPEVLTSNNNLAMALQRRGAFEEAETLHREVLAARRRVFGAEHVHVAISLNNLGTLLYLAGRYEEAAAVHHEALAMQRKLLGDDHPDVALSLNNLGAALKYHGDLEEAGRALREAIDKNTRSFGPEHPRVLNSQNHLADVLSARGQEREAESLYRSVLMRQRRVLGPEHPKVATTMLGLGRLLVETLRPDEAEPFLRDALRIRERLLPEDDWRRAVALSALGASLSAQGRTGDAEPLLLSSYATLKETRGEQHVATRRARRYLALHYERRALPEQALLYRVEDNPR